MFETISRSNETGQMYKRSRNREDQKARGRDELQFPIGKPISVSATGPKLSTPREDNYRRRSTNNTTATLLLRCVLAGKVSTGDRVSSTRPKCKRIRRFAQVQRFQRRFCKVYNSEMAGKFLDNRIRYGASYFPTRASRASLAGTAP